MDADRFHLQNVLGLGISDRPPGKPTQQIDFAALANASKHTIHVKESLDGVVQSLSQVCDFHEKYLSRNGAWLQRYADSSLVNDAVGDALRYQLSAFKAVAMRIDTLEKRIKMLNETVSLSRPQPQVSRRLGATETGHDH